MNIKNCIVVFFAAFLVLTTKAAESANRNPRQYDYILTDRQLAASMKLPILAYHEATDAALVQLNEDQRDALSHKAHESGKCAGHEWLSDLNQKNSEEPASDRQARALRYANQVFKTFDRQLNRDRTVTTTRTATVSVAPSPTPDPLVQSTISQVSESNIQSHIDFLAAMPSRHHKSGAGQKAANDFKSRIETTLKGSTRAFTVELIPHKATPMNSIRVTIPGTSPTKSSEIIVIGGHLDSINQSWFGKKDAPGADDNASGSANVLEVARLLANLATFDRTLEFYWYAGEEGGLLGSAEIAADAKANNKNVVAVVQLDMTMYPGDGEFHFSSMTDFTSLAMRDHLRVVNSLYVNGTLTDDKCGYGCSDHASWYKQGFPTLMPAESSMKTFNQDIHTARDTVNNRTSIKHAAMFGKLVTAFAMTLP